MPFFATYPALSGSGGGGGGGVTSINGDTTAAQVISAGTGISVSSVGGTTTITNTSPSGGGTVTSVSVTTANGVSGTVATATTTPAISLSLGAITPTSVNASGTLTGSNFSGSSSGSNTGDQTITLTGDVTGSGTGSFAATIANNAVTNAKAAQMAAHTIKGNNTGVTANAIDLTDTQVTAELNQFTTTLQGVVPGSGGGTVNFLRADGTWATPPDTGITQLTGDVTAGPGSGSQAASLVATSNATLTTLSGLTTATSLASVGTVTTGTWNATTIAINHGGTGQTTANAAFNALSPLTTKGDLVGFSTVNARLPVGTNGYLLTADSGQTLGIKWAPPGVVTPATGPDANTTLTTADSRIQIITPTTTRTYTIDGTGMLAGDGFILINNQTPALMTDYRLFVNSSAPQQLGIIFAKGYMKITALINTPVNAADWSTESVDDNTMYPYTPTIYGNGVANAAITVNNAYWQRIKGETIKAFVYATFTAPNAGSGTTSFDLPYEANGDGSIGVLHVEQGAANVTKNFGYIDTAFSNTAPQLLVYSTISTTAIVDQTTSFGFSGNLFKADMIYTSNNM